LGYIQAPRTSTQAEIATHDGNGSVTTIKCGATCSNPSARQKIFLKLSIPLARISGTRIIGSMASPFFFYLTLLNLPPFTHFSQ
jgi:hypothetical protein